MKRCATALFVGLGFALVGAAPADAQLFNFPNYASPPGVGMPSTFVAGTVGRGLNDVSGKLTAFGGAVGRTGIGGRATIVAGGGLIDSTPDSEVTLGGSVAVDLLTDGGSANVAVQAGLGWMSPGSATFLNIPIGVSLSTNVEGGSANVRPWVMPRIHVTRVSFGGASASETDFGASGGVSVTTASGFGVHVGLDVIIVDDGLGGSASQWLFGGGAHYVIN